MMKTTLCVAALMATVLGGEGEGEGSNNEEVAGSLVHLHSSTESAHTNEW